MKIERAVHLDFHTLPNITDFGKNFNAEEFAEILSDSGVEYANIVASCNIGFCYFNTKKGFRYPYMTGDRFGDMVNALNKKNIGVTCYVNVGLNHEYCRKHVEDSRVNKLNQCIYGDTTGNFFRFPCMNNGNYQNYVLSIIDELQSNYCFDGFFFDGFRENDCYCKKCKKDMLQLNIDIDNNDEVKKFYHDRTKEFCLKIKKLVKDKNVQFCGMPLSDNLNTYNLVECLPSGDWGYDYFNQAVAFTRNFNKNTVYMSGRFQSDWGDFGGIKSKASLEYDMFDALSNGVSIMYGDHLHPKNNLDKSLYGTIKDIYKRNEKLSKNIEGMKIITETAVFLKGDIGGLEKPEIIGSARMLDELKYPYDLVDESADFNKYKLIIFPDNILFDEKLADKVSEYLSCGGKIITTGKSGLNSLENAFALKQYDFIKYVGSDEGNYPYFTFNEGDNRETQFAQYESAILIKNVSGKEYARYVTPYNKRFYDGNHGYFYTPPKEETDYSVMVLNENICHISFNIFKSYAKNFLIAHRELVKMAMDRLLAEPLIKECNLPIWSRVSIMTDNSKVVLQLRVDYPENKNKKGVIEEHNEVISDRTITLRGRYRSAYDIEEERNLSVEVNGNYTKITLPLIIGYKMILLRKIN